MGICFDFSDVLLGINELFTQDFEQIGYLTLFMSKQTENIEKKGKNYPTCVNTVYIVNCICFEYVQEAKHIR